MQWRDENAEDLRQVLVRSERQFVACILCQDGHQSFPGLNAVPGGVCKGKQLAASKFAIIVSINVFEHLADPEQAVNETARLPRPGGIVLVSTSHWDQCNARHDLEVMYGFKPARCAHQRPALESEVQQHAFVSEFRMKDFDALFSKCFDHTQGTGVQGENLVESQKELKWERDRGELPEYSDEELLGETCMVRAIGKNKD